jgi:dienelactone hydrolase
LLLAVFSIPGAVLDAQQAPFYYPPPPPGSVTVQQDVQYGTADTIRLQMDVYRPARQAVAAPALIFFNQAVGAQRRQFAFYPRWAEAAASKGVVAIVPDLRFGHAPADFTKLVAHLRENASQYDMDPEAISVYAASGNAWTALPVLQDPALTAIRSAVIYYGAGQVERFRLDLPILLVRAGLDRPGLNNEMGQLAAKALSQNAPVTVINHPGGYHAFEMRNDDALTRELIDATIEFVKRSTSREHQLAMARGRAEAQAAGYVTAGNYGQAATIYAGLVQSRPEEPILRLAYGEALLNDRQFTAACDEFEKLKGKGLGPRDLGLPAARACLQKGDPDAAIAWLKTIPQRFLPPSTQNDPAFAALKDRADFKALFAPSSP